MLSSLGEDLFKVTHRSTEERKTIVNWHDSLMGADEVLKQNLFDVTEQRDSGFFMKLGF